MAKAKSPDAKINALSRLCPRWRTTSRIGHGGKRHGRPDTLARIGTRIGRVPIERGSQHGEAKDTLLSPPDIVQATPAAEADARLTELIGALQAISAKAPGPDMPNPDVVHELDPKQDRRYCYEWGLLAAARIARAALRAADIEPLSGHGRWRVMVTGKETPEIPTPLFRGLILLLPA